MKLIRTVAVSLLMCCLLGNLFAQKSNAQLAEIINNAGQSDKSIPYSVKRELDDLLDKQNYIQFYDMFSEYDNKPLIQLEYLNAQVNNGHIPIYWLLSDKNLRLKRSYDGLRYGFIALIMTQQDSALCINKESNRAANNLLNFFKETQSALRSGDQSEKSEGIQGAIFFISNLKKRSHPKWSCLYSLDVRGDGSIDTDVVRANLWPEYRKNVLDKYINLIK